MSDELNNHNPEETKVNFVTSQELEEAEIATRTPPWGMVTVLEQGARYRINRIMVKPGHHISTQMHYHRSEHWVVVSGTAQVICNGETKLLRQKESTYVPMNTPHRVENPGVIPLVMIEIQNGEYLGDDDIIRFAEG
jgi:mannose-6-phosphate isomerase-like protein (cupin superfamily)